MINLRFGFPEMRSFMKDSWALGLPMILIMFFQFAIGITDVYVAGFLGTDVVAAVGYVGQLYWTLMIVGNGISVGTVSMVSQAYGARSPAGVGSITAHSLSLGFAVGGVVTVLAALYPGSFVRSAGMPAQIEDIATPFLRIFALVLVPTYFSIITAGVLRASDRVRIAMVNSLIAALINVVGDFALAFGWGPLPALGFRGIAWASAGATTVGMLLNLIYFCRGPARIRLNYLTHPLCRCWRNLVKLGGPSALQQVAWNAGTLVVYFLVGRLQGGEITALAAMTAGLRVEAVIFLPIFAFNMAAAVITGNHLGAGDVASARSGAKAASLLCIIVVILPAIAVFIFARDLAGLLTSDAAVIAEMTRYLRINMLQVPVMSVGVTLAGALQGAGDTFATMRIVFTGMWIIRIPLILGAIYWLKAGPVGIWWAMAFSIVVMCGMLAYRFSGDKWTGASIDKDNKTLLWEACLKRARTESPGK
jgi:putative MATE family efflux protein